MKYLILLLSLVFSQVGALITPPSALTSVGRPSIQSRPSTTDTTLSSMAPQFEDEDKKSLSLVSQRQFPMAAAAAATSTGLITGLVSFASYGLAGEEIEMAELPPPYVPALFAVALLIGVGVLTGSLGDVMTEESQLGMQSGARARKEIERSRSSYFKKR